MARRGKEWTRKAGGISKKNALENVSIESQLVKRGTAWEMRGGKIRRKAAQGDGD